MGKGKQALSLVVCIVLTLFGGIACTTTADAQICSMMNGVNSDRVVTMDKTSRQTLTRLGYSLSYTDNVVCGQRIDKQYDTFWMLAGKCPFQYVVETTGDTARYFIGPTTRHKLWYPQLEVSSPDKIPSVKELTQFPQYAHC